MIINLNDTQYNNQLSIMYCGIRQSSPQNEQIVSNVNDKTLPSLF